MSIEGWYYLHTNGDLIFKKAYDGTAADIRESDFARAMWPMDPSNRANAWQILVEGNAAGANKQRIAELAAKWYCDDTDATHYANYLDFKLFKDGNQWCAAPSDFINLQESPCGFGDTALDAMAALCTELGYKPSKMWGNSFPGLLAARKAKPRGTK